MSLKKKKGGGGRSGKGHNYCHVKVPQSFPKQPHSHVISFCSQVNNVSICSTFTEDNCERAWYLYTHNYGSFWFPLHFNTFFFLLGPYFTRYNYILIYRPSEQIFYIHTEAICWLVIIHIYSYIFMLYTYTSSVILNSNMATFTYKLWYSVISIPFSFLHQKYLFVQLFGQLKLITVHPIFSEKCRLSAILKMLHACMYKYGEDKLL